MPQIAGWYVEDRSMTALLGVIYAALGIYIDPEVALQSDCLDREAAMTQIRQQLADHINQVFAEKVERTLDTVLRSVGVTLAPVEALTLPKKG